MRQIRNIPDTPPTYAEATQSASVSAISSSGQASRPPSPAPSYRTIDNLLSKDAENKAPSGWVITSVVIPLLQQKRVNVNMRRYGTTALHCAARDGNKELVEFLLQHGAHGHVKDDLERRAVILAAQNGHADVAECLMRGFWDCALYLEKMFFAAATRGQKGFVEAVLKYTPEHARDQMTAHAVAEMAESCREDVLEYVLRTGVDINGADSSGRTALHLATYYPHAVQMILAYGGNVKARTGEGMTPFLEAAKWGHVGSMDVLLDGGANISEVNNKCQTALHLVASAGFQTATKLLVSKGADVGARDDSGRTPLDVAVQGRQRWVVEILKKFDHRCHGDGHA
ncbi:ankyrin repeat-containing domain protein [Aspergillus floccosus]